MTLQPTFPNGPPPTARAARPPWRLAADVAVFASSLLFAVVVFALRAQQIVLYHIKYMT